MSKQQVLLFALALFLGVQVNGKISPFSLIDQVKEDFAKLKAAVEAAIAVAEEELATFDVTVYAEKARNDGTAEIISESQRVGDNLNSLKDLAAELGYDIRTCLVDRENQLNNLVSPAETKLNNCINDKEKQAPIILKDAVDQVDSFRSQLNLIEKKIAICDPTPNSIECIGPIIREIEDAQVDMPNAIQKVVVATSQDIDTIKLTIDDCQTANVADYTSDANQILDWINDCVTHIIGG